MNRLFVTALKSVGLVGAGDDPEAQVTFWKSRDVEKDRNTGEFFESRIHSDFTMLADSMFGDGRLTREERIALSSGIGDALDAFREKLETEAPELYERDPEMVAKAREVAEAIGEMLPDPDDVSKMVPSGETAPDDRSHNVDLSAIEDQDLRKSIEDALAEKDDLSKQVTELTEKVSELTPDPDPVEKADDEVRALIEKEREEREKLEKQLAEERSARRTAEFIEKAKGLEGILGKPSDVGPVLADIAEKAPDSFEKLDQWITAAAQQADLSELFKQRGAGEGDPERDPQAAREAYIEKARKDGSDKTDAELAAEFWQTAQGREMKKEMRS